MIRRGTLLAFLLICAGANAADLWELANSNRAIHRFSTLFTAQDVRDRLSTEAGIDAAIDWCKRTAVTRVYVESFRDGYQAERQALVHAKERFEKAGIDVSGCITTTGVGKRSTGWRPLSCYTDKPTQQKIKSIFEYTASIFDEIMIDDFWFTDCTCEECEAARKARTVTVGDNTYPVSGDTWEDYRCELMVRLSRDYVLAAAKKVNPKARLILKYPQWYDRFHERGYEVARETADYDRIWVGTETRDRDKGGVVPYEAYFIMRWLGRLGGDKTGGGWYDPYDTTEQTYIEQARQTILGGARESMLFCYGGLQRNTGPANVEELRRHIPELFTVAGEVAKRQPVGIAAYKPPNSHPEKEQFIFDYAGMLGLPLVPCHEFPEGAQSAFFSVHALKDPDLAQKLSRLIERGRPVMLTDGLAEQLKGKVNLDSIHVQILPVGGDPKSLLKLTREKLEVMREPLLRPFRVAYSAPNEVGLYLFDDGSWAVENFTGQEANVDLNEKKLKVPARGWTYYWRTPSPKDTVVIRPVEIHDVLLNPGMGVQTFQRFNGDPLLRDMTWSEEGPTRSSPAPTAKPDYPGSSLAYFRWYWLQIEPKDGQYRWEIIDNAIAEAQKRGQKLDFRVMPYDEGHPLPEWYRNTGARRANKPSDPDGDIWSPDSGDPMYLKYWNRLTRELGKRYDGHPGVNSVDISTVGYWGEGWGPYMPDWDAQKALIDAYLQSFRKTPLLMNYDVTEALAYATKNGAGWRLDCWGDMGNYWDSWGTYLSHMFDTYPQTLVRAGAQEAWRSGPVSLETCWVPPYWKVHNYNIDYIMEQALRWHVTSVNIKSARIPPDWKGKFEELQKKMGYRFILRRLEYPKRVQAGAKVPLSMWWLNAGVAPAYDPYDLALELRSGGAGSVVRLPADVRKWLPGDSLVEGDVSIPAGLKPGEYRVRVALLDPRTGKPGVKLAIEGLQPDGWYDVGSVKVE